MILTVTLNVAVDKRYVIEGIKPDTVMRAKEYSQSAGGKGINVAKVATKLGEKVVATGFVGGHSGEYIIDELNKRGIQTDFVKVACESRSSINIFDSVNNTHSQLLEPGSAITQGEYMQFLQKYKTLAEKSKVICICGSIPPGVPKDCYSLLVFIANELGKTVLLDASGEILVNSLKARPTFIKPNNFEIEELGLAHSDNFEEIKKAAIMLYDGGIENVVVSLGEDGAILVCKDGIFKGETPEVSVVNTVGCGDSMVAAFAAGLANNAPVEETFKTAIAVSTANALSEGAGEYNHKDFDTVFESVKISKIN